MNGPLAMQACILEATARKVGNVHPHARFADVGYAEFMLSAAAVGGELDLAHARPLGETILRCVTATRHLVQSNTNLGIILLLAPLCAVEGREALPGHLESLGVEDSRLLYRAIREAQPGGLGKAPEQDLGQEPTLPLLRLMHLARERDAIAAEYCTGFAGVWDFGVPALLEGLRETQSLEGAILGCQLAWLARQGDTLVRRKRGEAEDGELIRLAREVQSLGWRTPAGLRGLAELDAWLRQVGHARNPGATADLVTACLFVALRERRLNLSHPFPWPAWNGLTDGN